MGQRLNKNQKSNILSSGLRGLLAIVFIAVLLLPCLVIEGKTSPIKTSGPGSFSRLVKQASPSVVNISAVRIVKRPEEIPLPFGSNDPLREFFNRFVDAVLNLRIDGFQPAKKNIVQNRMGMDVFIFTIK